MHPLINHDCRRGALQRDAYPKNDNCFVKLTWFVAAMLVPVHAQAQSGVSSGLISADLYKRRVVGDVQLSPDGSRVAYGVTNNDQPGRPYSQTWVMKLDTRQQVRIERASSPRCSA